MKITHRKTKVVGKQTYINQETGELVDMNVIQVEERDCNFHKIWIGHIASTIRLIGNKKMDILDYLWFNMAHDNLVIVTQRDLVNKINVSLKTISETFKALIESDFMVMVQQGVYRLNPNIIFKGTINNRLNILIMYNNKKAEAEKNKQESEEQESNSIAYIDSEVAELQAEVTKAQKQIEKLMQEKAKIKGEEKINSLRDENND